MSKVEFFRDGDSAVFQFADTFITARPRSRRERDKTSRIFVWDHDDVTVEDPHAVAQRIAGTYTTSKGDFPEVDKAFTRYNRAIVANYRRHLDTYREILGDIVPTELRWSQYAGCSCPCSSGFVASRKITFEGIGVVDLYVQEGNYRQIVAESEARRLENERKKAQAELLKAQEKVDALA